MERSVTRTIYCSKQKLKYSPLFEKSETETTEAEGLKGLINRLSAISISLRGTITKILSQNQWLKYKTSKHYKNNVLDYE